MCVCGLHTVDFDKQCNECCCLLSGRWLHHIQLLREGKSKVQFYKCRLCGNYVLDTLFTSIHPVSWRTLLQHVQAESNVSLEALLADVFSLSSTTTQKALLKDILGDSSDLVQPILESVTNVSVIMLVNFCKFRSSC